ncbi:unnamed protein product [Owenia fusiformis]|uniref:Pyridoxal kinase n=1 Tax=Owenia fusiformis TaxID=6347 RepID=A0A8J1TBX5_OWEFU|nr:unnamed protein product [Owenia fusiformis]
MDCRVLSIQSHVVHGYVGNKSATFPLQVLGFEVDTINSVQFSNHTGYMSFKGQVLNEAELGDLFEGLISNNIHQYTHLLTGYIGSKSFLLKIKDVVKQLKEVNPSLIYVCDPVMGDHGKMYVPQELLPIYREEIIPLADIVTPNQFEAEILTGQEISTEAEARNAMTCLHNKGVSTVVISSSDLGDEKVLIGLGSTIKNGSSAAIRMEIPRLPADFTGTGDLFASLLLAHMYFNQSNIKVACEKVISTMQCVLCRTLNYAQEKVGPDIKPGPADLELRLIQSKKDIEDPTITVKATLL